MNLPPPRGPLSERLTTALTDPAPADPRLVDLVPTDHDDAQLSLWVLYQLHHAGFEGVSENHEWDPALLAVRAGLEKAFEERLRSRFPGFVGTGPASVAERLFAFIEGFDGPSLAIHVQRRASREQVRQLLAHRSLYHLHEADQTTWLIPRLSNRVKAAVVELQYDEYGGGDPQHLHAQLFARGMAASGLDPTPFVYVDQAPVEVLELNNAMTLFALHRRLRAASVGHLAAYEATSSLPSRRMAQGLERLGFPGEMRDYYLEHVEADAVHEQLAVRAICAPMVAESPELLDDVFFGAFTCLDLEARFARRLLAEWDGAEVATDPTAAAVPA